jgi:uncharacterized protein (TIGR02996 family)
MARARTRSTKRTTLAKQTDTRQPAQPQATDRAGLAAALQRAAGGKQPLAELLAAWSLVPAAELADAIEGVPPAQELLDVTGGNAVEGLARLTRIDNRRDPRTSAVLAGWLADPPWHATGAQPFYKAVFARLEHVADPRAIAKLASAARAVAKLVKGKSMRTWLVERIGRTRDALAARFPDGPPTLTAAERARVKRAAKLAAIDRSSPAPRSARTKAGAELLAAIRANPSDDAARHVYADVLVEQGDPRGEFIVMQLARAGRPPTASETKAELAILAKHVRIWLGELAGVVGPLAGYNLVVGPEPGGTQVRFERGFLAGCMISGSPAKVKALLGHAELATVEELTLSGGRGDNTHHAALLQATPMPALRSLDVSTELVEIAIAASCAPRLQRFGVSGNSSAAHVRAAEAHTRLSTVRELAFDFHDPELDDTSRRAIAAALVKPKLERLDVSVWGIEATYERTGRKWIVSFVDDRDDAEKRRTKAELVAFAG